MKQVIQYQKNGNLTVEDLPPPLLKNGGILVRNECSLISAGTERSSVKTAQASILGKIKSRPDLVKQVLDNYNREGFLATIEKINNRLDNYKELGYSCAGTVIESSTPSFKIGDNVACAGTGYASHSEIVFVPQNLAVKIPASVSFEEAAFTTLCAIALQGVRQADVKIGENVVVIGLGLLGLITTQLLHNTGCNVVGVDIDDSKFGLARSFGCSRCVVGNHDSINKIENIFNGIGADAVIITASTNSNEPIEYSIEYARKRATIVIVGAVGMNFPRAGFYEKELIIKQSCSYGPGRYDVDYEEKGIDYPPGYVRWTENRNMSAVLNLMSQKKIDVKPLISHRFKIDDAIRAYDVVTGKSQEPHLGIVLDYPKENVEKPKFNFINIKYNKSKQENSEIVIGCLGAGNFAQAYLIPHLRKMDVQLSSVVTSKPINAKSVSEKFNFKEYSTNPDDVFNNSSINTVFISTRHDSHAKYVLRGLESNKNIFVEKPLALNIEQLKEIKTAMENSNVKLMVGFNRRFSDAFQKIYNFFYDRLEPMVINYRINAGYLGNDHWYQQAQNGGRIIGEVCHFIDSFQFLTHAVPVNVYAESIDSKNSKMRDEDNVSITIKFSDGSMGTIIYLANGNNSIPKEFFEIFCEGKIVKFENFKKLEFYENKSQKKISLNGEKGHKKEITAFINSVKNNLNPPIEFSSLYTTTLITFLIHESLKRKEVIKIE